MSDSSVMTPTSGDTQRTGGNSFAAIGMDTMSPYYLHPSDGPSQVHVADLLTEGNYGEWLNDMSTVLYAKNKFGFVDGSIPKPSATSEDFKYWVRNDAMVRGWLKSSMEKDVRSSVRSARTAHEIWTDLSERFGKGSAPRAFELRRAIANLRQDKLSVSAYYTKLKSLWDEVYDITPSPICSCNGCTCNMKKQMTEIREKEHLYDFLMGLDDSFATIKTQILSSQPVPSVGVAYHLVSEDEQQRNISATRRQSTMESAAFQIRSSGTIGSNPVRKGERPRCSHCGKNGHLESSCFELIGYPPDWRKSNTGAGFNRNQAGAPNRGNTRPRDSSQQSRPTPRAAQVTNSEEQVTTGLTQDQINLLLQQLAGRSGQSQLSSAMVPPDSSANMAGINFEEPDWSG